MKTIHYEEKSVRITLVEKEDYNITLKACEEASITIDKNIHATILLCVWEGTKSHVKIHVSAGASLRLLHQMKEQESIVESVEIEKDASLDVGFYTFDATTSYVEARYLLMHEGARVNVITSAIASGRVEYDIACVHKAPFTHALMEHYAISKDSGKYILRANGTIQKGAHGSSSHQSTRALTMGEAQNARVTPLLLIDENDVEASHACALGAMNEDELYYLQTRGLTHSQALGLLTLSYVLPIVRIVENSACAPIIEKEIEEKVGVSCSM